MTVVFFPFLYKWLQLSIRLWLLLFFRSVHSLCLTTFKDKRMSTIRQEDKTKWCSLVYKITGKAWNRAWDLMWKQQPKLWTLQWSVLLIRVANTMHGSKGGRLPASLTVLGGWTSCCRQVPNVIWNVTTDHFWETKWPNLSPRGRGFPL